MSVAHLFHKRFQSGLSLVELLIVVAIIGILGTAAAIIINPVEVLRQTRDGRRVVDLQAIDRALGMYKQDGKIVFGDANTVYVSLVDTVSSACASHSLPPLPSGWSYRCVTSEGALRRNDGTGWIPVNFASISTGPSIPTLPVDPTNSVPSGFYYAYVTSGVRWALVSLLESTRYLKDRAATDGGTDDGRLEIGPRLSLWSQASGLAGYWKFDEGTGTAAIDSSLNNNNGALTNGPTWQPITSCKVGDCLNFDGVDDFVRVSHSEPLNSQVFGTSTVFTLSTWAFPRAWVNWSSIMNKGRGTCWGHATNGMWASGSGFTCVMGSGVEPALCNPAGSSITISHRPPLNSWSHIVCTANGTNLIMFVDGREVGRTAIANLTHPRSSNTEPLIFGRRTATAAPSFDGIIDEVRSYSRALTVAEISAIFNATR